MTEQSSAKKKKGRLRKVKDGKKECIAKEEEEKRTSRDVAVRGVDEAKGPIETQLGRGI
jgi:hypothetical protein